MKLLRSLCAFYLTAASGYTVAVVSARHPALTLALEHSATFAAREGADAALAVNDHLLQPGWVLVARQAGDAAHALRVATAEPKPDRQKSNAPALRPSLFAPRVAQRRSPPPKPVSTPLPVQAVRVAKVIPPAEPATLSAVPAPVKSVGDTERVAQAVALVPQTIAAAPKPQALAVATLPSIPPAPIGDAQPSSAADLAKVESRLKAGLTKELLANFNLFIYVSKAEKGPIAQRMYVYDKGAGDHLSLLYDWPVSTGREVTEVNARGRRLGTHTPAGYYELDPHRVYRHYTSGEWDTPMPYAMFFNWVHDGYQTGLAIHSAWGQKEVSELGSRASAGCVRLSPQDARRLFELIKDRYAGPEARFAMNRHTETMSNKGELARDGAGNLSFIKGYRVLVIIEDYSGKDLVAIM